MTIKARDEFLYGRLKPDSMDAYRGLADENERLREEIVKLKKDHKQMMINVMLCMEAVRANIDELSVILPALTIEPSYADHVWSTIEFDDQKALMIAPTKGGFFTTKQRAQIQDLWRVSHEDMGI